MFELKNEEIATFREDGFVFVENLLDDATCEAIKARYEAMFRGDFETGVKPDEVNWQEGKSDPSLTRQICNGWKGDRTVASVVLREDIGRACATLGGWPGARIKVDNVLWKPPGTRPLGSGRGRARRRSRCARRRPPGYRPSWQRAPRVRRGRQRPGCARHGVRHG